MAGWLCGYVAMWLCSWLAGCQKRDRRRAAKGEMTGKGLLNSPFLKRTVEQSFLDTVQIRRHGVNVEKRKQDIRTGNSREINGAYEFNLMLNFRLGLRPLLIANFSVDAC